MRLSEFYQEKEPKANIIQFLDACCEETVFHPDTPFEDYININTGDPTFTAVQSERLNKWREKAFVDCNTLCLDIYGYCIDNRNN